MSKRSVGLGGLGFALVYFAPPVTGLFVAYKTWTDWAAGWHWALRIPACLVVFGVWTGIIRIVLLSASMAVIRALSARVQDQGTGEDRLAGSARVYRKRLLVSFGLALLCIAALLSKPYIINDWAFLVGCAVIGLYYGITFVMAASMVWGGWWAGGAMLATIVLNKTPLWILSGVPLAALLWSLTKVARGAGKSAGVVPVQ